MILHTIGKTQMPWNRRIILVYQLIRCINPKIGINRFEANRLPFSVQPSDIQRNRMIAWLKIIKINSLSIFINPAFINITRYGSISISFKIITKTKSTIMQPACSMLERANSFHLFMVILYSLHLFYHNNVQK